MIYVDVYLRGLHTRRYFTDVLDAVRYAVRQDGCKHGLVITTFRGKK